MHTIAEMPGLKFVICSRVGEVGERHARGALVDFENSFYEDGNIGSLQCQYQCPAIHVRSRMCKVD